MTLKGSFEFKVLSWVFSCHGQRLILSGQAWSTSAWLPKPHYELSGFRVGRTGGLKRRLSWKLVGVRLDDLLASIASGSLWESVPQNTLLCYLLFLHTHCWTFEITWLDGPLLCPASLL